MTIKYVLAKTENNRTVYYNRKSSMWQSLIQRNRVDGFLFGNMQNRPPNIDGEFRLFSDDMIFNVMVAR